MAIVAARDRISAENAAKSVRLDIEDLEPVLSIEQAMEDKVQIHEGSNVRVSKRIRKGDAETVIKNSKEV
ncbi:hypothetical protein Q6280_27890, partial [Klebsiella pneumoniae]|uniref:hypothetical protein n=1 Tax=Klebsiella pneumoniae TaxID=573 RepID=UPI00273136BF